MWFIAGFHCSLVTQITWFYPRGNMSVRVVLLLLSEQHARMSVRTSLYVFPDVYAFEYDLSERRRDELLLLLIDS